MRLNERCVAEFSTSSAPTDKEGFLNKKGELNRGYQRRWFILKGNLLYYFEKRSDKEPIGVIVLDNCHVELAESGEPYAFQITFGGDGRTYILGADTPKEMESWMRAITHSSYEYLKMMVESFESKLEELTAEENDLVTAGSSSNANSNSTSSVSGASNFNCVDTEADRANSETLFQMPVVSVTGDFGAGNSDVLDNLELPKMQEASGYSGDVNSDVTLDRTGTPIGNLINLDDDDDDDDQIPIQNEFAFDEGFYSFPKQSSELMPLSYSDMERLEDMHNEDLLSRLSGNMPSRSKDDFDVITRVKREAVSRSQRPKSERRRNNARTMYENAGTRPSLERGKTLPKTWTPTDDGGFFSEHGSVFRYLHELYSASIWVKCKEFWRQDNLKS